MKLTFTYIDLEQARRLQTAPADIIPRESNKTWLLLDKPIEPGTKQNPNNLWRFNYDGKFIRVPLLPYCSVGLDAENAIGHAVSLGFTAAAQISTINRNYSITRLHLSIGTPIEELEEYLALQTSDTKLDCFRYWIGISAEVN